MALYGLLLRLYPSSFRAEYGGEMRAIFEERWMRASGVFERLGLLLSAAADVLPNAFRVHAEFLGQDARYTLRMLARSPGFAAIAIAVTALGIGSATATFSILDHVLLRPLPFPDPERLVRIWNTPLRGPGRIECSPATWRDWRDRSKSFERMGAYHQLAANLVGRGDPARVSGWAVEPDFFTTLEARPALGRPLLASDDAAGAPGAAMLSDSLWRSRFGADPGIVGSKILLDDEPFTVIGVMPRGFDFPNRETEIWTATRFRKENFEDRSDAWLQGVARLKPGVTLDQARAEMQGIQAQLAREHPREDGKVGVTVNRLRDELPRQSRTMVLALFGASLALLLIACANLANLLLARALARRRELAVRTAMGADRRRLVRQLVTESLILSGAGGALGVALAIAAVPLTASLVPLALPASGLPRVDVPILLFALALTGVTGIAFGVAPALRACSDAESRGLREGERGGASRGTERLRAALVIAEVTASVSLLIGAGLLLRALWRLQALDPGFRSTGVLTMRTNLPLPRYAKTQARVQLYRKILSDVRSLPGVESAAYATGLPMDMRGGIWGVAPAGAPDDYDPRPASMRFVTPGFFDAMGIPLRTGRDFAETDSADRPLVVVVSESLASRLFPGESAIGRRILAARKEREIVGVVADVRVRGHEQSSEPQVYVGYQQVEDEAIIGYIPKDLAVRTTAARPASLLPAIRAAIAKADPTLPVSGVRLLSEIVDSDTAPRQVQLRLLGAFAALAFLLAGLGIHGLLAFVVSQRAREIGVRMALGAQAGAILRMVLRRGGALAAVGALLGAGLAYAGARAIQSILAGVSPADGPTFLAAAGLALVMTLLGSLVPALRAARLDPAQVIRSE